MEIKPATGELSDYDLRFLVTHLVLADKLTDVRSLLAFENPNRLKFWFELKAARAGLRMAREQSDLQEQILEQGMAAASVLNPVQGTAIATDILAAFLNCYSHERLAARLARLHRVSGEQERSIL